MRYLRSMFMGCLGLIALAACSMPASAADHWPLTHEITSIDDSKLRFVIAAVDDVATHVVMATADPVYQPAGVRSTTDLKPEYLASYRTHGLNFIEVRSRC